MGKKLKFVQPAGTDAEPYFPIGPNWPAIFTDTSVTIYATEGEAKALAMCKAGMPTFALGGVSSFQAKRKGHVLLPLLDEIDWHRRRLNIVYDSDVATNPDVARARDAFANVLIARGAKPHLPQIPAGPNGEKQGADEYLLAQGGGALTKLCADTPECVRSVELCKMNLEFAYVAETSIVVELATFHRMRVSTFVTEFAAPRTMLTGTEKPRLVSTAAEWMKWPQRNQVRRITCAPGGPLITEEKELNIWRGWGCEPHKGDTRPFVELLAYMVPEPVQRDWFLDWLAFPLQNPGAKMATAAVLLSQHQGVGKTTIGHTMRRLYGQHNTSIIDQDALEGSFNAWVDAKQFIVCEEVTGNCGRRFADKLKNLITGTTIIVNEKFLPAVELPNRANLIFLTNHLDAFHIDSHDRRLCVLEIKAKPLSDEFFKRYYAWLDAEGSAALFDSLLRRDLSRFNPNAHALKTEGKARMIEASRSDVERWCSELFDAPDSKLLMPGLHGSRVSISGNLFTTKQLLDIFRDGENTTLSEKSVALALRKAGFERVNNDNAVDLPNSKLRPRLWAVRNRDKLAKMSVPELASMYELQMGITRVKTRIRRVK